MSSQRVREEERELGNYVIGNSDALRRAVISLGCDKLKGILEAVLEESADEIANRVIAMEADKAGNETKSKSRTMSAEMARQRKLGNALRAAEQLSALIRFALRGVPMSSDDTGTGLDGNDQQWLTLIIRGEV